MSLVIGGPLQVTMPSTPLFLAEAVIVEFVALTALGRRPVALGAAAASASARSASPPSTSGPMSRCRCPGTRRSSARASPSRSSPASPAGLLGATMAQALRGELLPGRRSLLIAVGSVAAFIGLGLNASITGRPDLTANMQISNVRMGEVPNHSEPQRVGDLTIRLSDPSVAQNANWFYALGWQGGGRYLNHLVQQPDGSWKTTKPVPLQGSWKTMVRVHKGRDMVTAPIRFPADPALGFAGFSADPQITRAFMADTTLMQIERKDDVPAWAWTVATIAVLSTNLLMVLLMGIVAFRLGRIRRTGGRVDTPNGLLLDSASRALGRFGRAHPVR